MTPDQPGLTVRLFVAVELPPAWRKRLTGLQRRQELLSPGYFRWVRPDLLHLTVLFLGDQPSACLEAIAASLDRAVASIPPFSLTLGRIGHFGPPSSPRVLWVEAVETGGHLMQLRAALERALREASITFDHKPLVPHVTLGRARRTSHPAPRLVSVSPTVNPHLVHRIVLLESQLAASGPVYHLRAAVPLVPAGLRVALPPTCGRRFDSGMSPNPEILKS